MFLYCDSGGRVTVWACSVNSPMFFFGRTVSDLSLRPHIAKRGEIFVFLASPCRRCEPERSGRKPLPVTERAARQPTGAAAAGHAIDRCGSRDWHALTAGKASSRRRRSLRSLRTHAWGSGSRGLAAAGGRAAGEERS